MDDLYGIEIEVPDSLSAGPSGDHVEALLCASQAAWPGLRNDVGFFGVGHAAAALGIAQPLNQRRI
jgi:hypothetical protein